MIFEFFSVLIFFSDGTNLKFTLSKILGMYALHALLSQNMYFMIIEKYDQSLTIQLENNLDLQRRESYTFRG